MKARLEAINSKIVAACGTRDPSKILLLAVSKRQPFELMAEYASLVAESGGIPVFGENYVQEYKAKREKLRVAHRAHLIGPLQVNKARTAVALFDVIESVHSVAVAQAIDHEANRIGKRQKVYLQINISSDDAKSGFAPSAAMQFIDNEMTTLQNLELLGVMTITRQYDQPTMARSDFAELAKITRELGVKLGVELECSMGMSTDFEVAIEEGATEVRLGTVLFGERS